MSELRIAGGWYCDARPDGAFAVLIPDDYLATHRGNLPLPPFPSPSTVQNLLYLRIAPDGIRIAGQGQRDDRVWEWDGTRWQDRGAAYGVSPVIYDHSGRLLVNNGSWGSQGARYIDAVTGRVVTADETYFSPVRDLSEFTAIGEALYIGQSHPDGTNDAAWVCCGFITVKDERGRDRQIPDNRLLEPGPCRFIRAHRDGDRCSIAIWKPGQGAVIHWLTLDEIRALPAVTLPNAPQPQPEPEPEPVPTNRLETVQRIRAKYPTPLGARHWEFLVEVAHATGAHLFRKDFGDKVHVPALGFSVSQDIVILPATRQWVDILGDAETSAVPAWSVHEDAGEQERWIDVSRIVLPGEDDTPEPQPGLTLEQRVERIEAHLRSFR